MSRAAVGIFKQGWNEIPELMGSGLLAIIGATLGIYRAYRIEFHSPPPKYKIVPLVIRPDDPRVEIIRRD